MEPACSTPPPPALAPATDRQDLCILLQGRALVTSLLGLYRAPVSPLSDLLLTSYSCNLSKHHPPPAPAINLLILSGSACSQRNPIAPFLLFTAKAAGQPEDRQVWGKVPT